MTWKERLQNVKPELVRATVMGGCSGCPGEHFPEAKGIRLFESKCPCGGLASDDNCAKCWNSEIPGTAKPTVKTCGTCKYLEKFTCMEPCASCISVGCDPTNWKPTDEPTLTASDVHYINNDINVTKEIADELERQMIKRALNSVYGNHQMFVQGRRNGKTYDMQRLIYSMLAAGDPVAAARKQHHDGLSAQLFTIDEMHSYKPKERKTNMPTSNDWFPHGVTVRNGGTMTILPAALPEIEDVIFNPPATIVFWKDKTKTVVKANNEEYDPEKGLAMAMIKKLYGNKGNYCNKLKKWTDKYFGKYPDDKVDEKRANVSIAYDLLTTIRDNRKMTKSQMVCDIEDAIAYLGEALED